MDWLKKLDRTFYQHGNDALLIQNRNGLYCLPPQALVAS
jgi:hypothetical protein